MSLFVKTFVIRTLEVSNMSVFRACCVASEFPKISYTVLNPVNKKNAGSPSNYSFCWGRIENCQIYIKDENFLRILRSCILTPSLSDATTG